MKTFTKKDAQKILSEARKIEKTGNYALIYANFETGSIWCNEYADANSWTNYSSPAVVMLCGCDLVVIVKNFTKFKNYMQDTLAKFGNVEAWDIEKFTYANS